MKTPFTNKTTAPVYVGPVLVRPGESRMVNSDHLPPVDPVEATEPPKDDPLAALLKGDAKEVMAALAGLSAADLAAVLVLEQNGKARKTVLAEIAEQQIKRAAV